MRDPRVYQDWVFRSKEKTTDMNILITNETGDKETAALLRAAISAKGREHRIVTLLPKEDQSLTAPAMGLMPTQAGADFTPVEGMTDTYQVAGYPLDLLDYAHLEVEQYLTTGHWDLVLIGVSPGAPLGTERWRSTPMLMAFHVCASYQTPVFVVTQDGKDPALNLPLIGQLIREEKINAGEVIHLALPAVQAKTIHRTNPAHYQPSRIPPTTIIPRARHEDSDVTWFRQGQAVATLLHPRLAQKTRW